MSAFRFARAGINIPKRIDRGPTDILKAIASTVKYQPDQPDPHIHDDPYLLPRLANDKYLLPLSRISGKNTARFILNKHPELFYRDDAEPKIRAFSPPEEFREDMEFTLDDLRWCIDNKDPVNGIIAYRTLVEKEKIEVEGELLYQFFEMICYTNEDPIHDLLERQKQFFVSDQDSLTKQNWKRNGLASKIFNRIKQDTNAPRVYSAMISGLVKHNEHQTAKEIFEEFKEFVPGHGLFSNAYQYLLSSVPNLNSSVSTAHQAVDDIVRHMEEHSVKPNLRVFNSLLDAYMRFNCDTNVCRKVQQIMTDMKSLDIEPSPFTYLAFFRILNSGREIRNNANLIDGLLKYISTNNEALMLRDERDVQFLTGSMILFANRLNNMNWANQIYKIFLKQPKLFGSSSMRNTFHDVYFRLMINTDKLENILDYYDANVPSQFKPTYESYDLLAEALDLFQADEKIIKRIGLDLIQFRVADKLKNDSIFRRNPEYVEKLEERLNAR